MKRAIGIIRVSELNGRDGDRFHSPTIQRERIQRDCETHGLELAEVIEELDVSGGKPLGQRKGLSRALAAIESGQVAAIVFAYRDRMDRSIDTASELCRRMDQAGGLLVADGQIITHATHDGWRRATFESFLNEDQRRAVSAKMRDVHIRNVTAGVAPFPIPPGYRRRADGVAEPDHRTAEFIRAAFQARADGESMPVIRRRLSGQGVKMSLGGLSRLLSNRFYLGELHYRREGVVPNLTAHEPLIDLELFERVKHTKGTTRGRTSKSPHLLARLGVLRCGSCGGRMSVTNKGNQGRKTPAPFYRCTASDCDRRMTIGANIAESVVWDTVSAALRDVQGRASIAQKAREAHESAAGAESNLESALRVFRLTGTDNEPAAVERIAELVRIRDEKRAIRDAIGPGPSLVIDVDNLTFEGRRNAIRKAVVSAVVGPGRGPDRIVVNLRV